MERIKKGQWCFRDLIERSPQLMRMASYIDVYDASVDAPHIPGDPVYLSREWYGALGQWFAKFITE